MVLWNALQPGENTYNWNALDSWINVESALNKPFGLGLDTYEGACCGGVGVPDYVFQRHPSAKVVCPDGEVIPKYWDPGYQEEYRRFIQTFGQRYDGDPRIAFLQIGVGVFGETQPAYDAYDKCLSNAGLTSAMWVEFVEWTIDTYRQALPNTPLVLEFVPRFIELKDRRLVTDYAARQGVGLQHSGLRPDGDGLIINDPRMSFDQAGQYDPC